MARLRRELIDPGGPYSYTGTWRKGHRIAGQEGRAVQPSGSSAEVLIIASADDRLPTNVAEALETHRAAVCSCTDVYRGLVRAVRNPPRMVIVAVDWLTTQEMQFFRVLRRRQADTPILVLASRPVQGKIEQAIGLGATAELTPDAIDVALAAIDQQARDGIQHPRRPLSGDNREKMDEVFASAGNQLDAERRARLLSEALRRHDGMASVGTKRDEAAALLEEGDAVPQPEPADEDEQPAGDVANEGDKQGEDGSKTSSSARVPWLRYRDAPQRIAPRGPAPPPAPRNEVDVPLLTPEELDALLGGESQETPPEGPDDGATEE